MPLIKTITNAFNSTVYVWNIQESEAWLRSGIELNQNSINRLFTMSSELHRRGFLSIRHLLDAAGYNDHDLFYDDHGKPHLRDGRNISITHSFEYTAVIVSDVATGIDIEKQREKIKRIAIKFIGYEKEYLSQSLNEVEDLTVIWGAKESMYKSISKKGLGFKEHCKVSKFEQKDQKTTCKAVFEGNTWHYEAFFTSFEDFTLVYILPATA
ncbi:4'-phosphopantetheinyl transferase family protein [Nonlabens ponticola]|uniref:4'-phosphopantetheinyl transferase superfamily protein n=1 Tax=Nonlabens ponticola TaxID=2496866 RepID=A0A3S9MVN1_9FLAO|nr:4'-phosphopantetheinyl transferase superfamily protein [Nonlabens ponticola]AZQ43285.1 4'-phosphopantetheinyl transferase superfamily protein [Nonlabens ponticola]